MMTKVSFLGGITAEFELPDDWTDRSIASFAGPEPKQMRSSKAARLRTSFTVSTDDAEPTETLEAIMAQTRTPPGVDVILDELTPEPMRSYRRVFRFQDPMTGTLIQQQYQIFFHEGRRYTAILSCEPMRYGPESRNVELHPRTR